MNSILDGLLEQRKKFHNEAMNYLKSDITPEIRSRFDAAMAKVEKVQSDIDAVQRSSGGEVVAANTMRERRQAELVGRYLRFGIDTLSGAEKREMSAYKVETRDGQVAGTQSVSYTNGPAGGYLVPATFAHELDVATKWFANLMNVCRTIKTDSGAIINFPTSNDTAQTASQLAETVAATEEDVTFGTVPLNAYKYTSGLVKVSGELLQDSAFDLDTFLAQRFGERFGRRYEADFTNGSGSGMPKGILTAVASSGVTPVTAIGSSANDGSANTGANSIGSNDLVNLEHSIDPSYRRAAKYMFHDATLGFLKGLLDKFGRPLWTPSMIAGEPDRINGYEYVLNQSMPKIGASNVSIVFGAFEKYVIRQVQTPSVKRLNELYATSDQIGFVAFARVDATLIDAGTHPLNVLQQHS
jgi:HK97 family phage major capsid protein